jgi:sec-independent protein translocase protein TatB
MNIFSNLGVTELVLILLLALLVVGPERLPELARKLGTTLRDLRRAYDNLTRDLGPELASFQETAQELRDSVDSVRNIPQDMIGTVVKSTELDGTLDELKGVRDTVGQMGQTLTDTKKVISDPLNAAASTAQGALSPSAEADAASSEGAGAEPEEEPSPTAMADSQVGTREAVDAAPSSDAQPPDQQAARSENAEDGQGAATSASDQEGKETPSEAGTVAEATMNAADGAAKEVPVEQADE